MLNPIFASLVTLALVATATAARASASDSDSDSPNAPNAPSAPSASPAALPTESAEKPTPTANDNHDDLLITAGVGAFGDGDKTGGALGLTGLRQNGLLGYGATFEYGSAIFDYTTITAAPLIGIFVDGPPWARVGLAATGGLHHYEGVGRGFLSSDPGASGTTPFVGARAFLGAELGGKARFHVGLQLSVDDDLTRTRTPYTFTERNWTAPHPETTAHTVGALRFGGMLALGTAFDL